MSGIIYGTEKNGYDEHEKNWKKEAYMKQHFISMLRYMADQKTFTNEVVGLGEEAAEGFGQMADYIEKEDLLIHGFTCFIRKERLLQLLENEEIFEIYVGDEY